MDKYLNKDGLKKYHNLIKEKYLHDAYVLDVDDYPQNGIIQDERVNIINEIYNKLVNGETLKIYFKQKINNNYLLVSSYIASNQVLSLTAFINVGENITNEYSRKIDSVYARRLDCLIGPSMCTIITNKQLTTYTMNYNTIDELSWKSNNKEWTPVNDYDTVPKKYVDDELASITPSSPSIPTYYFDGNTSSEENKKMFDEIYDKVNSGSQILFQVLNNNIKTYLNNFRVSNGILSIYGYAQNNSMGSSNVYGLNLADVTKVFISYTKSSRNILMDTSVNKVLYDTNGVIGRDNDTAWSPYQDYGLVHKKYVDNKIENISLTPGPQGPKGDKGDTGPSGTLNTTNTISLSTSSNESLAGNINLHKVSKTGNYNDLINLPTIPTIPTDYVKTSGAQTIAGVKTFSSIPVLPSSNPTSDNQAVRKGYVDDNTLKFEDIPNSSITVKVNGANLSINNCLKLGNVLFVSLMLSNVNIASGNVQIIQLPYKPNSGNKVLVCNVYGTDVQQNVCYVDSNGIIHVDFKKALSNTEIRITGFYTIQ